MLFKIKKKKSPLISTKDIRNHPNAFISLLEKTLSKRFFRSLLLPPPIIRRNYRWKEGAINKEGEKPEIPRHARARGQVHFPLPPGERKPL